MVAAEQYWTAEIRRDELLDVLQRRGNQSLSATLEPLEVSPAPGKLVAIWKSETLSDRTILPQVLVGELPTLEDLWAWAFSYLRGLGALTAQVKALTPDEYHSAIRRRRKANWWKMSGGYVGIVIAEAIAQTRETQIDEDLSLLACRSTLSFVLARAVAQGMSESDLYNLSVTWEKLRLQTGQSPSAISVRDITSVAASLLAATTEGAYSRQHKSRVSEWLAHMFENRPAEILLRELDDAIVGKKEESFVHLTRQTPEERVRFFDEVLPSYIEYSPFDRTEKAFIIALVAFITRPGFSQQLSLLTPSLQVFPDARLWLGAMQALYSPEETLAYGYGLGWRVSRDIFESEDLFSAPRHDISFSELQILIRSRSLSRGIQFLPKGRLDVELMPGVSTLIRSLRTEGYPQGELPIDNAESERDAAMQRAKTLGDAERSLEAALNIIRGIRMPAKAAGTRRKSRR